LLRYCWFWSVGRLPSTAFMPRSEYSLSITDGQVTPPRSAIDFSPVFGEAAAPTPPNLSHGQPRLFYIDRAIVLLPLSNGGDESIEILHLCAGLDGRSP
jgi:hypothetical protein